MYPQSNSNHEDQHMHTITHNETRRIGGSEWYKSVMMRNSWECDERQVCGV